jgi:hypothetical protein
MARSGKLPDAMTSDITCSSDDKNVHGKEAFIAF